MSNEVALRHTKTASPQHLDAQLDLPRLQGRIVANVQLGVRWNTASLMSVTLQPDYDWAIFLDELARLERAALGEWYMENAGQNR